MASYRVFRVGSGGRLLTGEVFEAADDRVAIDRAAERHLAGEARELWQGGRLVGRFSKLGAFTPGPRAT